MVVDRRVVEEDANAYYPGQMDARELAVGDLHLSSAEEWVA